MTSNSKTNNPKNNVDTLVINGVLGLVEKNNNSWSGTMTQLSKALKSVTKNRSLLPGSPSALRVVLNRVTNRLRNRKISVRFARTTDHARTRYVKFSQ